MEKMRVEPVFAPIPCQTFAALCLCAFALLLVREGKDQRKGAKTLRRKENWQQRYYAVKLVKPMLWVKPGQIICKHLKMNYLQHKSNQTQSGSVKVDQTDLRRLGLRLRLGLRANGKGCS
jgi:hypothetical protein